MENESIFVDTSAFYALMDRSDSYHQKSANLWASLLEGDLHLKTSNYVIVESLALLQSRLGFNAADLWYRDVLSLAEVLWVDSSAHSLAYELWLSLGRKKTSFVDCVSFALMRHYNVEKVFGFDRHFRDQGFQIMGERSVG